MNTEQAQNLMARYQLTHKVPMTQPAYVIAYAIGKKGMAYLPALSWVKKFYKDNGFTYYTGTWNDTMSVINMYMKERRENENWHHCEACGYDAPLSKLSGYMCCWLMYEDKKRLAESQSYLNQQREGNQRK